MRVRRIIHTSDSPAVNPEQVPPFVEFILSVVNVIRMNSRGFWRSRLAQLEVVFISRVASGVVGVLRRFPSCRCHPKTVG